MVKSQLLHYPLLKNHVIQDDFDYRNQRQRRSKNVEPRGVSDRVAIDQKSHASATQKIKNLENDLCLMTHTKDLWIFFWGPLTQALREEDSEVNHEEPGSLSVSLSLCWLFIFKVTEPGSIPYSWDNRHGRPKIMMAGEKDDLENASFRTKNVD